MPRVIPSDVLAIRPSSVDAFPFIQTATLLVDTYLGSAGLPAGLLVEIECWWAAHLMDVSAPSAVQTRMGDTSITMDRMKLGEGLKGTRFGQQVLALDPTGTLAQATIMKRATIFVD